MSLRSLPEPSRFERPKSYHWDAPSDVLSKWAAHPLAAEGDDPNTISIYDVIGEDFWSGGGFTAKRMAAALRSIGSADVTVNINSPGGDMFEGIAIYNLLRQHKARVTVNVMGWAASAASVIAMAGDNIRMGLGTFMMVHNAWGMVIGNRHDMRDAASLFDSFDAAIADIYEARTEIDRKTVEALMDAETFMGPSEAIEHGFADVIDEGISAPEESGAASNRALMARRQTEAALARAGFSRQVRSEMLSEIIAAYGGARDADPAAARDAGVTAAELQRLIDTIKN